MTDVDLYSPPDVPEAWDTWKASCGPAAVAAILRRPVMETKALFPGYRGWANPTHVMNALRLAEVPYTRATALLRGLAFIQFKGPWEAPGVPVGAAYRHTHWVAVDGGGGMVYDINAQEWLSRAEWESRIMPALLADQKSPGWWVRYRIAVED